MQRKGGRMEITIRDLKEMEQLEKEILDIEEQLNKLECRKYREQNYVADTVKDYRSGRGKVIVISGYDTKTEEQAQSELLNTLAETRAQLMQRKVKIEMALRGIEDAEVRRIIRLKVSEKRTWDGVAAKMGKGTTADACRKKIKRYLEKI